MTQVQSTALIPTVENMSALSQLGRVLATSGFFEDARQEAQAVVKVLAGQEIGIPPIAAMTGVHVIKGKISIGANIMAGLVKKSPRYDYKVVELDAKICRLQFFEGGQPVGESSYTLEEAKQAELVRAGGNWAKFPKNMLFARAVSNGTRLYCPDLLGGSPVYTPDELGAQVDEYGEVIEGKVTVLDDTPPEASRAASATRTPRRAPNTPPDFADGRSATPEDEAKIKAAVTERQAAAEAKRPASQEIRREIAALVEGAGKTLDDVFALIGIPVRALADNNFTEALAVDIRDYLVEGVMPPKLLSWVSSKGGV